MRAATRLPAAASEHDAVLDRRRRSSPARGWERAGEAAVLPGSDGLGRAQRGLPRTVGMHRFERLRLAGSLRGAAALWLQVAALRLAAVKIEWIRLPQIWEGRPPIKGRNYFLGYWARN